MGIMRQNLYRNYLTDEIINVYQVHRGVLFTPLSLVPLSSTETLNGINIPTSRKNKFLVLSERGALL